MENRVNNLSCRTNTIKLVPKSYVHGKSNIELLFNTIGERLRMAAAKFPHREFVIFKRENIRRTYQQVLNDSIKLATGLIHMGITRGDRVGMWGPNSYEWIVCQYATALAGAIMVNINPSYQTEELKLALKKVGIKALIAQPSFKKSNYYCILCEIVPELSSHEYGCGSVNSPTFPELKHLILIDTTEKLKFRGAWSYSKVSDMGAADDMENLLTIETAIQPDDPVNIQFTSGTTGVPKGATLTHHNTINNAYFVGIRAGYHEKRTIICIPNPLYHCFGCVMGSLSACVHYQTCVFPAPSFEPLATLESIHEERCTALYGTPTMYIDMLYHPRYKEFDCSSIYSGIVAGSPCPVSLCHELVEDLGMQDLQVCYGTTETSPVSFMSKIEDPPEERIKSVGYVMEHLEATVVGKDGKVVPRGDRGEVIVRGYSVMRGYWDNEEQTRAEITPDRWYHSGDIGVLREDGTLCIVGRKKDMILRGGENIYPTEIEQYLHTHPDIENVQVVGVPDERLGEAVCAWIRLRQTSNINEEDIRKFCAGKIAHFKIPRYIIFKREDEFPLTATGKIKKFEIRNRSKIELGLENIQAVVNQPPWVYETE